MPAIPDFEVEEQFALIRPGLLQTRFAPGRVALQLREPSVRVPDPILALDHVVVVERAHPGPAVRPEGDVASALAAVAVGRFAQQRLSLGDRTFIHPKAPPLSVIELEPERALVLGGGHDLQADMPRDPTWCQLHTYDGYTWSFFLDEQADGSTRFVARIRVAWSRGLVGHILRSRCFLEPAHTIMQSRMNRGLKERVEG